MPISPMDLVKEAKDQISEIDFDQAQEKLNAGVKFIDVREAAEFAGGFLGMAFNVPRGVIEFVAGSHPEMKNTEDEYVLYCRTGGRSALATMNLGRLGYTNLSSINGGFEGWVKDNREVQKPAGVCG